MPAGVRHADDDPAHGDGRRTAAIQAALPKGLCQCRHGWSASAISRQRRSASTVRADRPGRRDRSQKCPVRGRSLGRDRKIGDGTHRRGIVNVAEFEQRFGVTRPARDGFELQQHISGCGGQPASDIVRRRYAAYSSFEASEATERTIRIGMPLNDGVKLRGSRA